MRRALAASTDQLIYLDGGGCVIAIGVAFSVAGAVSLYLGLTVPITFGRGESAGLLGTLFCTALSFLFLLFGGAITISRSGVTLDRKGRTADRWWGVWNPWGDPSAGTAAPGNVRVLSRPRPSTIDDRTEVCLSRTVQKVPNKDQEQIVYPVRLNCHPPLLLIEHTDDLEARHLAEEVARFLGLALVDSSSGTEVRRKADTLDQPLKERIKQLGLPAVLPPAPVGSCLSAVVEGERLIFTAPREPLDPYLSLYLLVPVLVSLTAYYYLFRGQSLEDLAPEQRASVVRGVVMVLGLPLLCGVVGFSSAIYWGGRLAVSPPGISVRARGELLGGTFLPVAEVDEVRVGKANGQWRISIAGFHVQSDPNADVLELQLVGKHKVVRFGRGRLRAELEWLRDVILKALAD